MSYLLKGENFMLRHIFLFKTVSFIIAPPLFSKL